jgi:uncharacterized protein YoxC
MGGQRSDPVHWVCTNARHLLQRIDGLEGKVFVLSSQLVAADVVKENFTESSESFSSQTSVQLESRIMTRFKSLLRDLQVQQVKIDEVVKQVTVMQQQIEEVVKQVTVPQHQEVVQHVPKISTEVAGVVQVPQVQIEEVIQRDIDDEFSYYCDDKIYTEAAVVVQVPQVQIEEVAQQDIDDKSCYWGGWLPSKVCLMRRRLLLGNKSHSPLTSIFASMVLHRQFSALYDVRC